MKIPLHRLIPFSSVDGPGNRTAVFVQGCNFNCQYYHNPETRELCNGCALCIPGCPRAALTLSSDTGQVLFDPGKCIACDQCIRVCPHDASPRIREMDAKEVFQEIRKNLPFIRGVTVSGGECTLYPEFLKELAALCHSCGLSILLDSNGSYDFERDPAGLLSAIDGVMLDVKAWNNEEHLKLVGKDNFRVLTSMKTLAKYAKLYEVRTVVVPGKFDVRGCIRKVSEALLPYQKIAPIRYKIIAYRPMGVRERYRHFETPSQEMLGELREIAENAGMPEVILI